MTAVIPSWHLRAACQYTDPDAFFPEDGETDRADEARGVCIGCPVRRDCFLHAMTAGEMWGMWGGLTERERLRERRPGMSRPAAAVFTEADGRYYRRQASRIAEWDWLEEVAAMHRKADETAGLAA